MWTSTFLLLVCLGLGALASSSIEYQDEVPGHENQCKGMDKKFYKLGEKMPAETPCAIKTCQGSAQPGSVYMEVKGCSKVTVTPGCELKADKTKNFPDCCGKLECGRH